MPWGPLDSVGHMGSMEHRTALASGKLHEDHIKLEPDMREVTPLDRIDFACHTVRKLTSQRILVRMVLSRQLLVVEAPEMSDGRSPSSRLRFRSRSMAIPL